MSFDNTKECLLSLLSNALFQKPLDIPENTDFKLVYEESLYQAVCSLAFSSAKDLLDADVKSKWELSFNMDTLRNSVISFGHTQVHNLLSNANIDYVILKGCVSASYYPVPMLRRLGDVDFLVKPEDFDRAKEVFIQNGFQLLKINHEYEVEFRKDDVTFELHRRVNGIPDNKLGRKIDKLFSDVFEKSELVQTDFSTYMSPSVFHHGLVMLLHVARHMITGGIGLRHLCDWAVFVNDLSDDFESVFKDRLQSIGLWKFAQILTQLSTRYIGCPVQKWAAEIDEELLNALKDDIFEGGNFGKKDLKRADEAKFITSRKDGSVSSKSNFSQAIVSANEIVRKHWSFAHKLPIVYPFGWLYFGGKYIVKTIFGKREKKNINALIKGADKRKEIYNQLRLFEGDENEFKIAK